MVYPEDLQETMDFDAGNEYGAYLQNSNLWMRCNTSREPKILPKRRSSELVKALQHEKSMVEPNAQRLLLEPGIKVCYKR